MLNQKYLRHDYATDVLTFDMGSKAVLEAEIIISAQTAQRNAAEYGVSVKSEIVLYMIHGVLHVLGYDDHTPSGIKKMRRKEAELMKLAQAKES